HPVLRAVPLSSSMARRPPSSTLFPYTTLFRSSSSVCRNSGPPRSAASIGHRRRCRSRPSSAWHVSTCPSPARTTSRSRAGDGQRSEEHTSELQSREKLVCRLLLEKKKIV